MEEEEEARASPTAGMDTVLYPEIAQWRKRERWTVDTHRERRRDRQRDSTREREKGGRRHA